MMRNPPAQATAILRPTAAACRQGGGGASVAAARARYSASTAAACTGLNLTVFWQQAVREDGAFTLKVLNSVSTLVICFYYES